VDDSPVSSRNRFERGTDGPRVILVGVDGSPTSLRAAAYAAGLARRQGSRLVAVYVAEPAPPMAGWVPAAQAVVRDAAAEVDAELRAELAHVAQHLGVDAEYRTARGDPVTEIARIADALPADAVLVGASEQAGHRMVGSVAVRLVRLGHWPVTVVP
jgi:nucleotide-binding universal stress UspA family protein